MARKKQVAVPETGIHDIPVLASAFKARIVSAATVLLLGPGLGAALLLPGALSAFLLRNQQAADVMAANGMDIALYVLFPLMGSMGFVCAICGIMSFIRNRITYSILRSSLAVVYPLLVIYVIIVWQSLFDIFGASVVVDGVKKAIELDGEKQDRATILLRWWGACWPALAAMVYTAWLHIMLRSRSVYAAFTNQHGDALKGDFILEDIRTHGTDPRSRRSMYGSVMTHIMVIIIIPWLLESGGCVEPYRVPKGPGGSPAVAIVKMVKPKKPKKKKSLTLRPNSAIIFEIPDLDDTEVDQIMEEQTQVTYQALANAKTGPMGKNTGATGGGWPEGMDDYKIRFIRLDHGGAGWDDGMDDSGADINFLRAFAQNTGFKKIASKGESHSIKLLGKYPKDGFPPFVYMTGNGNMGGVSSGDMKMLRDYCINGGLLIADAGSPHFHNSFTHFVRQVFPDKPLIDIADDDMIYQQPYGFPNGAPAFWHHGGRRALGIKHEGRWIVFYHPGDMNDAWKSPGFNDVTPEMRDAAMQLGINLVYYAFNQWDDAIAKARK